MKIRTQLVLAFLLLSVLPLTGIVLYSYSSSQRAVRKAVEAEAEELTRPRSEATTTTSICRTAEPSSRRWGTPPATAPGPGPW
jgi:hypothetical protein